MSPASFNAVDDFYTMTSGSELDVAAPGVLALDSPPAPGLTMTALLENNNALGTVVLRPDGSFSYVPSPGFTGVDTFTYAIRDSAGDVSNTANVSINVTGGGPPTPTVAHISPASDTTVTGPVAITATLTPPPGETIGAWTASYRRPGDSTLTVLATGVGPNVSAIFDPTLLKDGTYAIDIKAQSSGGGILETESGLIVDGTYKPGRYATTVQDMTVNAGSIPIQIQRTYDSTDKAPEDFGVGWSLGFSNFRIDTNGALGAGGWSGAACGSFGGSVCYTSTVPHVVTITWPDGHVDRFDLTPGGSASILSNPTAAFTPEAGTTDSLQAVDNNILLGLDGNFYEGSVLTGPNGIYDPLQFVLTTRDGTQYTIDRHAGLLAETDPNGNTVTIDSSGIHSSTGQSVVFNRDAENRIRQIVGPKGTIDYSYLSTGDLSAVAFPNGHNQSYKYDLNHNLTSISGDAQVVRTLNYDSSGRIIAVTDGNGHTSTITSNVADHTQVFTDAAKTLTTVDSYDARGDLVQQDRTFGGKTVTTKSSYDTFGHQLSVIDPLGHTSSQTYDASGNVLTYTDANGHTTTFTYNAFGKALTATNPKGAVTVNAYDGNGNLLTTTNSAQKATTYTYDTEGLITSQTDPAGRKTSYSYDASGNPATQSDGAGNTIRTTYSPDGRLMSRTDPLGDKTSYAYDAEGNLFTTTDPRGGVLSVTYNQFNEPTVVTDQLGRATTYTYDNAGHVVTRINPDGVTTSYTYDADNNLTSETTPTGVTRYAYDPLGRRVEADNLATELNFAYDDAGHLLTETSCAPQLGGATCPAGSLSSSSQYTYDPTNLETSYSGPAGTTNYGYDANGRVTTVTDPAGHDFAFAYDVLGRPISLTRPNGDTDNYTWSDGNIPLSLTTVHNGTTLAKTINTLDPTTGRGVAMTDLVGTNAYTYDADGNLTSATHPSASGLSDEAYTYDPDGNRLTGPDPATTSTYDAADQLLTSGRYVFTYNGEGSVLTKTDTSSNTITTNIWDADQHLMAVAVNGTTVASYQYDPLGRRIKATTNGQTITYTWNGLSMASQTSATGTTFFVTTPGRTSTPSETLETINRQAISFPIVNLHDDWINSAGQGGDLQGTNQEYSAFGQTPTLASSPLGFDSYLVDSTASDFAYARYYDPSQGRFLSRDTFTSSTPSTNTVSAAPNPYTYTGNRPISYKDPSGRDACTARPPEEDVSWEAWYEATEYIHANEALLVTLSATLANGEFPEEPAEPISVGYEYSSLINGIAVRNIASVSTFGEVLRIQQSIVALALEGACS